jgi:hypothetical protein
LLLYYFSADKETIIKIEICVKIGKLVGDFGIKPKYKLKTFDIEIKK